MDTAPRFTAGALTRAAARPPAPERMASPEVTADYLALGDRFAPREILLREAGFLTRPDHDGGMRWKAHQTNRLPKLTPADIAARWRILKSIRCPVLIVRGQESPVFEAALALEMTRMMAAARLIQIPNAGHYVHRDNPELFDKAVLEFLC